MRTIIVSIIATLFMTPALAGGNRSSAPATFVSPFLAACSSMEEAKHFASTDNRGFGANDDIAPDAWTIPECPLLQLKFRTMTPALAIPSVAGTGSYQVLMLDSVSAVRDDVSGKWRHVRPRAWFGIMFMPGRVI